MNLTKYIGLYQSLIKDSHIHLKQNTISTLKSVPPLLQNIHLRK